MADNPKPVDKAVHGGAAKTTTKGPHGGGNKYNQLSAGKGFMVHDAKPGSAHDTARKPTDGSAKKK